MGKKADKKAKKAKGTPQNLAIVGGSGNFWSGGSAYQKTRYPNISLGFSNYSDKTVNQDSAMRLSAVWACVRLIAETISTLPLKVYRKKADGTREAVRDHYLAKVLCDRPNPVQTPSKLVEFLVASLELRGNAYFEKRMIANRVIALVPIPPQDVQSIDELENGTYLYRFLRNGVQVELPDKQIWHVRGFGLDGFLGLDSVAYGGNVFGGAMAADESSGGVFKSGLSASGFLTHEAGVLKPNQRESIRQSLDTFTGSKNAGKVMVLEAGLKYQGITLNPESAQLLETRQYSGEEICRWFRVPPHMVGITSKTSSWAASVEGMWLQFLTTTLRPILVNIEQSISKELLNEYDRREIYAEFNVEGLLRADSSGRAQYYATMLDHGVMNRNEVRRLENLEPVDGGEIYTVQSALINLADVGENYQKGSE